MITQKDKEVIAFLQKFRYARTSQIQKLFFPTKTGIVMCRRRMRIISSTFDEIKPLRDLHNAEYIWTAYHKNINSIASLGRIQHYLAVVDLYIDVREYAGDKGEIKRFDLEYSVMDKLIADVLLIYINDKNTGIGGAYFVEVDMGTESLSRINAKLKLYESYLKSKQYLKADWNTVGVTPRVVYVCKGIARARNIQRLSNTIITCQSIAEIL